MKYYIVTVCICVNKGTPWEDCYEEEYTGVRHATRAEARKELMQAISDFNYDGCFIKEVA